MPGITRSYCLHLVVDSNVTILFDFHSLPKCKWDEGFSYGIIPSFPFDNFIEHAAFKFVHKSDPPLSFGFWILASDFCAWEKWLLSLLPDSNHKSHACTWAASSQVCLGALHISLMEDPDLITFQKCSNGKGHKISSCVSVRCLLSHPSQQHPFRGSNIFASIQLKKAKKTLEPNLSPKVRLTVHLAPQSFDL